MVFLFTMLSGGDDMKNANLTSQVDGETTVFTVPEPFTAGSLRVYYNGVRQVRNVTFTETNATTFTLTFTPVSGEYITVDYQTT